MLDSLPGLGLDVTLDLLWISSPPSVTGEIVNPRFTIGVPIGGMIAAARKEARTKTGKISTISSIILHLIYAIRDKL